MIAQLLEHGWYDYFFVAPDAPFRLFHGLTALLCLVLIPAIFKHLGLAMGTYVLVSLLVPLSASQFEGIGRYSAVLFPAFMLAGTVTSLRAHEVILIVFALFQALFICLFVTLRPIYCSSGGLRSAGSPDTLSRAPLRRPAPFAWLTHCARSL